MIAANVLVFTAVLLGRRMAIGRAEGGVVVACCLGYLASAIARTQ